MNRRNIIISIVLALSVLLGGAYWYFTNTQAGAEVFNGLFPGESSSTTKVSTSTPTTLPGTSSVSFSPGTNSVPPLLYKLHNTPVSGVGFTESKNTKGLLTNISARYLERSLGNIFETPLTSYEESRIVNETRPRISEALWGNNGNSVVIRSVNTKNNDAIISHIVNISAPGLSFSNSTTTSSFLKTEEVVLSENIPFLSTIENGDNKLFYFESSYMGTSGMISTFKNTAISKVFDSSFTEWLPQFPNQNLITITTKPSYSVPGYLYFINTNTKSVTKILGGKNGLTTLTSHDGKFVLFSETNNKRPDLFVYNVTKNTILPLYLQGLPEKCTWGKKDVSLVLCAIPEAPPSALYPDQWYQGAVTFSDSLWSISMDTLSPRRIMSPQDFSAPALDIINPTLSSDDGYLLFMDKTTLTPWVYQITNNPLFKTSVEPSPIVVAPEATKSTAPATKAPAEQSVVTPDMQLIKGI